MNISNIIDYDQIEVWAPWVTQAVSEIAPRNWKDVLEKEKPEYEESAAAVVYHLVGTQRLVQHLTTKLADHRVRVYHGTRLSVDELQQVRVKGLRPLKLSDRKTTIISMLRDHKKWSVVEPRLEEVLKALGPGNVAGRREDNCVHVCFSRRGIIEDCNHYLTHGAEVDDHIVYHLFENDPTAKELLRLNRSAYLISFSRYFDETLKAANPYGFSHSGPPSFLKQLIQAWAYKQVDPSYSPAESGDCTAAKFEGTVGPDELEYFELLSDNDLGMRR